MASTGLTDAGKKIMLEAFGSGAVEVRLYDDDNGTPDELSGGDYEPQSIEWSYDSTDVILVADEIEDGVVAEFSVPACTVYYVGFLSSTGVLLALYAFASEDRETFQNPGVFQLTTASLELIDPVS